MFAPERNAAAQKIYFIAHPGFGVLPGEKNLIDNNSYYH